MKRVLAVLAALTILFSLAAVASAEDGDYDVKKWDFLETIGVLDSMDIEEMAEETLERGDFIIYLMRLIQKEDIGYSSESLFSDVDENDECFDAANNAKSMGYYDSVQFRPVDEIIYSEALEMLLKAMGYSLRLKTENALSIASELKFPTLSGNKEMTYNDMVELFYSAVHAPLLKYDISIGSSISFETDDGKTILSECYDIEIIEGIVTSNGTTSIYSDEGIFGGGIEIDEIRYNDSGKIVGDHLGYYVRAYIDFTEDEDFGDLVYIEEKERKNSSVKVEADEVLDIDERVTKITYAKENESRTRTEKIDENARVIYNGKFLADYSNNDFLFENGSITLIDNDMDDIFEIAVIWSYQTVFIDRISQLNKTVYNAYTYEGAVTLFSLDDGENEIEYEILENGENINFEDLEKNQVVSVAFSKNKEYVRLEMSREKLEGRIEVINNGEGTILIDGQEYEYIPEFFEEYKNFEPGENFTFYLDTFGNLAGMVGGTSDEYIYAYLYSVKYDDAEDVAVIKIFTQDAEWERHIINDYVRINGRRFKPREIVEGKSANDASPLLLGGETDRQIIKVKYDGTSLKDIETASENAPMGEFNKSTQNLNYYNQNNSFSSVFYITDNSIIFGIPSDAPDNLDAYIVSPSLSWDKAYNVTAYDFDEYGDTAVFTLNINIDSIGKTVKNCVVLDVAQKIGSEGIPVNVLRCSFGIFESFDIEIDDGADLSSLNKGDIIDISTNEVGKIKSYTRVFSWQDEGERLSSPDNLHSDSNLFGKVVKTDPDNKRIIMNLGQNRTMQPLKMDDNEIVVKNYNIKKNRCELTSIFDIEPGDYLVMDSRGSNIESILIYDKE